MLVIPSDLPRLNPSKIVFSDFDGTLTLENKALTTEFFAILELIQKQRAELVIVSGRSLSWGHFLLTHFPQLQLCIMEGGGIIVYRKSNGDLGEISLVGTDDLLHLESVTEQLMVKFPNLPISADSFGRKTDRAVEFEQMHDNQIHMLLQFLQAHKIQYTKSNVHINFWSGEVSKYLGVKFCLDNLRPNTSIEQCVFFGDAPNDQSMFQFFPNSVGVANIEKSLSRLEFKPSTILKGPENEGPHGVFNYLKSQFFS